jgi:hypothetical protein
MKKHRFNIFPEAKSDDYNLLRDDIRDNGYDKSQPIILYEGEIIDGWNRQKACDELGVKATYDTFKGTDSDALNLVMRTNKRRNLNKGQWACIAADADDLMSAIREQVEKERREKQSQTQAKEAISQKIDSQPKNDQKTAHKAAELFNTNRTYVSQAVKMKEKAPEVFEKVKAGKMTMQDANKAVRAIPESPWLDDEKERREQVEKGRSVVANQQRDKNLIQWAEKKGLAVRVDRGSLYGNPFILDKDGGRNEVCDAYEKHYLPYKRSILKTLPDLKGKVLICHCFPARCHAESLIK